MLGLISAIAQLAYSLAGFAFYFGLIILILSFCLGGFIVSFNENLIWFVVCLLCWPIAFLSGFVYWFGG